MTEQQSQNSSPAPNPSPVVGARLGLDFGTHHLRIGVLDDAGQLLHFRREASQYDDAQPASALIEQFAQAVKQTQASGYALTAIGLALPGLIHEPTQRALKLALAPRLASVDLRAELQNACGLPVRLLNNAHAAAHAEMTRGSAQGVRDWLYLHLGANVSAGLVLGGQLQGGHLGLAGALGEMTIDPERTGDLVTLESMVSAENVVRRTRHRLHRDRTSSLSRLGLAGGFTYDDIVAAAVAQDDLARLMLQRTGRFIGLAICEVISLLNLSLVAVGGAPDARAFLVPAIAEEAKLHTLPELFNDCRIAAAALGAEATVIGAAVLA